MALFSLLHPQIYLRQASEENPEERTPILGCLGQIRLVLPLGFYVLGKVLGSWSLVRLGKWNEPIPSPQKERGQEGQQKSCLRCVRENGCLGEREQVREDLVWAALRRATTAKPCLGDICHAFPQ